MPALIKATFSGRDLIAELSADGSTIALSGTNAATPVDADPPAGAINASSMLPAGFFVTKIDGTAYTAYTFADPDNENTNDYLATTLTEGMLSIAERADNGDGTFSDAVGGNEATFTVTLALAELLELNQVNFSINAPSGTPLGTDVYSIDVTINDDATATGTIAISGLTNACATPPCMNAGDAIGTLVLTKDAAAFTITADGDFTNDTDTATATLSILDQDGAGAAAAVTLGNITISNQGADEITYTVTATYTGTPVNDIIANAAGGIADFITATFTYGTFPSQTLTPSLNAELDTITLAGTNTYSGTGAINGIDTVLPAGFTITPVGSTDFTDPDGDDITETNATLTTSLTIAETGTDNSNDYSIMLDLAALTLFDETFLSLNDADGNTVTADNAIIVATTEDPDPAVSSGAITLSQITNLCTAPPCSDAESDAVVGTLILTKDNAFSVAFSATFSDDDTTATLSLPDQIGATNTNVDFDAATNITITRGDNAVITYTLSATYSSTAVNDIIANAGGVPALIEATFSGRDLSAELSADDSTIALSGTNAATAIDADPPAGAINASSLLPAGFAVTKTDGTAYTFADPDGENTNDYDATPLAEGMLSIAERVDNGDGTFGDVVGNNETNFSVMLTLEEYSDFGMLFFTINDPAGNELTGASLSVTTAATTGTIAISGLTNVCAAPPCANAEANIGTLALSNDAVVFTVTDFGDFANNDGTATLIIPDQVSATQLLSVALGNITVANIGADAITYTITAAYSSTPVTELIANVGGISALLPPAAATVTLGSSGAGDNAILSWENDVLTIVNIPNLSGNTEAGMVTLPTPSLLPAGFYISSTSYPFTDPVGTDDANINDDAAFTIAEGDPGDGTEQNPPTITDNNSNVYGLNINFGATPPVILSATDLSIIVTDTRGIDHSIASAQLRVVQYDANPSVTITAVADIRNFNEAITALGLRDGTVMLAAATGSSISIDITDIETTFVDAAGTESITLDLGSFSATENSSSTTYTFMLYATDSLWH